MKAFARALVVSIGLLVAGGLVAACSGASSETPSSSASDGRQGAQSTEAALTADLGGTMIWRPDVIKASDGQCINPKGIATSGSALTISVKADVTYVDLQVPGQLTKLVGLQVGDDYVSIPQGMLRVHVGTVELGNQFTKRGVDDVRACWTS